MCSSGLATKPITTATRADERIPESGIKIAASVERGDAERKESQMIETSRPLAARQIGSGLEQNFRFGSVGDIVASSIRSLLEHCKRTSLGDLAITGEGQKRK